MPPLALNAALRALDVDAVDFKPNLIRTRRIVRFAAARRIAH